MKAKLPKPPKRAKKFLVFLGVLISFGLPALSFALFKFYKSQPAQAQQEILSPLSPPLESNQELVDEVNKIYNLEYYLHLAKSFLNKATRLANDNPNQSDVDKVKIINALNEALKTSNEAIKYYPQRPEGYLIRAQVYEKIKHIWPESEQKAKQDLATANKLLNQVETVDVPQENEAQPAIYIPTQKANLAKNIIIAEPKNKSESFNQESSMNTNADSGIAVLEAGKSEVQINTSFVTQTGQIYLLCKGGADNRNLKVLAKKENEWFRVVIDKPSDKDIVFDWWIIN